MRLIDADELMEQINLIEDMRTPTEADRQRAYARFMVRNAPTIEAEPVRHGQWYYSNEKDWCVCSVCGTDAEGDGGYCLESDFCPHCGANMDGGVKK